jgi:hypothetical protein
MHHIDTSFIPEEGTDNHPVSTFAGNVSLPIHRWFRYSAGFSASWVTDLIEREKTNGRCRLIDPFVGSGTSLLEAESCSVEAIGIEAHPFVWRIARAKLHGRESHEEFRRHATAVLERAKCLKGRAEGYPNLIHRCFPTGPLAQLDSLKTAWVEQADGSPFSELTWLALASILRECSPAGTAPWQYVLPRKQKARVIDPFAAFEAKITVMSSDMASRQSDRTDKRAMLYREDARYCPSVPDAWADLVITSPPYANNYDYADATRLEMSFFGEVQRWGDLQQAVRRHLIRSCTHHIAKLNGEACIMIEDPLLSPIRSEIAQTVKRLEAEREHHGGKKPYHTMIAAYFYDMARGWAELRRGTCDDALVCFVIGDSAPYGMYVPVDRWLGQLALAGGFKSFTFEKLRPRNIKWKNRKHNVPLHEGILWIKG